MECTLVSATSTLTFSTLRGQAVTILNHTLTQLETFSLRSLNTGEQHAPTAASRRASAGQEAWEATEATEVMEATVVTTTVGKEVTGELGSTE